MMVDLAGTDCEIRQLHARYADAIFRKDAAAVGALFAEQGQWLVGGQALKGRDSIVEFLTGALPGFRRIVMTFRTPVVDVVDGETVARTWVTEERVFAAEAPVSLIGIYFDRFIRENGRLALNWRQFQTHYSGALGLSAGFVEAEDYGAAPAMPPV
jgi:uncharacterized protein (TIGR02246 family)